MRGHPFVDSWNPSNCRSVLHKPYAANAVYWAVLSKIFSVDEIEVKNMANIMEIELP